MFRRIALMLLMVCVIARAGVSSVYENKALNPVKFDAAPVHGDLSLIVGSKLNFVIVRSMDDGEAQFQYNRRSVSIAVDALLDAFERVVGEAPKVVDAASPEAAAAPFVISLGKNKISEGQGIDFNAFPKEGFVVKTFDKGVVIAGDDGYLKPGTYDKYDWNRYRFNGTANGAYDFIERILGIRYYYPGIGVYSQKLAELNVKPVSYHDAPVYSHRWHYAFGRQFQKGSPWPGVKNYNIFDKAWRMAITSRFYDPIHTPVPAALENAHPDKHDVIYYRDKYDVVHDNPKYSILDITNLELARLIVQDYKAYYDTEGKANLAWRDNPEKSSVSRTPNCEYAFFGQADHYLNDLPTQYEYLIPESRKNDKSGAMTDVYMRFYIEMAKEMKRLLPGKRLGVCSYHNYRRPPVLTKPEDIPDNIDVLQCTGTIALAKSSKMQEEWKSVYGGWSKVLGRPVAAYTYGSYVPFTKAIEGDYMRDFVKCLGDSLWKEGGVFFDAGFDYNYYYSYYLVFRTFWNPDFDNDAAMDEHWNLLYGPKAGAALKKFYALLKERWEKGYIAGANDSLVGITASRLYDAFNPKSVDTLEKLLKEAMDATEPESVERQRVEFFSKPWAKAFQTARSYHTMVIPVYNVTRLNRDEEIVIDGKLDEPVWQRANVFKMQQAKGEGGELPSQPTGKMAWDDKGLYFSFTGHGGVAAKKDDIWNDSDHIEFFLSPGMNKEVYYQFAVSAAGDLHQASKVEKPVPGALNFHWRCTGFKHAVCIDGDEWHLEFFIPYYGLMECKPPKPYTVWDGNFISNKRLGPKQWEYSSFALTMGVHHNPNMWGKYRFLGFGD